MPELDALTELLPLFPPESIRSVARTVAILVENKPKQALELALKLAASEEPATRAVAAGIISRLAQFQPALWRDFGRMLVADPVWEVRLHAARIFDSYAEGEGAAEYHIDFVFELVNEWVRDQQYLVRHAATQALLGWAGLHLEQVPRLLAALEPTFNDPIEYVRAGGVLALRAIGRKRPPLVLSYIELRLDDLGEFERETYLSALDDRFANAHTEWKSRLMEGLSQPPSVPPANIE